MDRTNRSICLKPLLLLIALLFFGNSALATTVILQSDDDMIVEARAIIRGRVLGIETKLDQEDRIYTYITLKVQEVLKGQITRRKIVLKQPGGEIGSRGTLVFGTPEFRVGEDVILYLDTWRDGSLRVHQMFLGKFSVVKDPDTGEFFAVRNVPDTGVRVLGQSSRGPITNRMELTAYTEMVRDRVKVNRTVSREFEENAYRGVPVLDRPAGYSSSLQRGELEPQFHVWNPPIRWFEPDSGQSVVFKVNPEGAPPQVENDVIAATNAWSSVAGCSLRVVEGGTTSGCGLFGLDGENSISFNNCDGYFSGSGTCSGGVLAVTSIANYDRDQTRVVNGVSFYKALEANLTFNPYASCSFGDHCQLQEIITHEMGHGLGLHHSWDPTFGGTPSATDQIATMYWVAHFDGRCASLRQDDMDGITFIYPGTGGGPGPLTILSTSPLGIGTVGSAFSRQLIASGGTLPYSWSLVSGSLPDGLGIAPSGLVSGTPTVTGTFDFTVNVTDAQSATAQKALAITIIPPATGYDSQFVSQNVPGTLQPGQLFVATIRWLNTGSVAWDGAAGFAITSQNPPNNVIWGGNTVPWVGPPVRPGEQMELVFQAFAPSHAGIYNFQWQLNQQGVGFFGQMSGNVGITVGDPTQPPPLSISGPSNVSAVKGTSLTVSLTAAGGTPPYSWSVLTGALPAGISLNSATGSITGTPTAEGSFAATVQVTDSSSQRAQKALTFTVTAPAAPPLEITTSTLAGATSGVSFNQQLNAIGGKPAYMWAVTTGSLPGGLGLGAATGIISGMPNATGSFSFIVTVTDAESHTASKTLSISVAAPPVSLSPVPSLETLKGLSFNYQLSANGGTIPYNWSVTSGALPGGLSLNATGGLISGAPTAAGLFAFTITVRDSASSSASATVRIKVIDPETIPSIRKVKYKGGRKLIVVGDRVNAAALLLIDGSPVSYTAGDGQMVVKPIALVSGRHEIRILNPGEIFSAPFMLTVQ